MSSESLDRLERLFRAAQSYSIEKRSAFLSEVCGGDADLRRELESLLQADEEAEQEGFLDEPIARLRPGFANQRIQFCTAADGVRIAHATVGEGPPLVKAANWLSHLEFEWESPVWRHWIRELAAHHTLIRYDKRGCGLSDWGAEDFSLEAQVQDLEAVVDAGDVERFPLLGLSGGGPVAVAYAVRHPERVSHLILYGGYAEGRHKRGTGPQDHQRADMMLKVMEHGWGQDTPAFRQVYTSLFMPEATTEQINWFNELQRRSTAPEVAVQMASASHALDVSGLALQVTVPTLVLHAREDAVVAFEQGRRLAALIPGARFVPLESKNHILLETEPAWRRFLEEIRQFLGVTSALAGPLRASSPNESQAVTPHPMAVLSGWQAADRLADRMVDHYEILEELGRGGMGVVYKARDRRLDRLVALKFVAPHLGADAAVKHRFTREVRAASTLDHPNICTIYGVAETDAGLPYVAMAYYEGEILKDRIARGPLPLQEALDYAAQITAGLREAHEASIVHRDVKPANVMVTERGLVKLLDFGVAKVADTPLTKTGAALGTVAYMSPEQARGEPVDPRTDLWALGAVLYEMLTGRRPFQGGHEQAVIYSILNEEPERITVARPEVPEQLDVCIARALDKRPERRFQSAQELLAELERIRAVPSEQERRDQAEMIHAVARTRGPSLRHRMLSVPDVVGRDEELRRLHQAFERARAGERRVMFVSGEAGMGKTTLIEAFLGQVQSEEGLLIGRGQCLEHRGEGEPYLPVLEALGRLCKTPRRDELVALLTTHAPTWLMQLPWLLGEPELERLQRRLIGVTRERMLREFVEALERATKNLPLILVLEDLHWSDHSTVRLIDALARRWEPAQLLVIGSYRSAIHRDRAHPLYTVVRELCLGGYGTEVELSLLSEAAATDLLQHQLLNGTLPEGVGRLVHRRTGGNPLFISNVVDYWRAQELLVEQGGTWHLSGGLETLAVGVPASLRQMIEQQLDRLHPSDQRVLEAASVVGMEFSTAGVAAGTGESEEEVENQYVDLAKAEPLIEPCGLTDWADGTVATRFRFAHSLYQEVLYDRVPAGHRARLHRRIGTRLEAGFGDRAPEHAAQLAHHFVRGRDSERAFDYLQQAAENALQRSAHHEAIELLTAGVDLLRSLPSTPRWTRRELALQTMLGPAYVATRGWGAPEAEAAYERARALCQELKTSRDLVPVLFGMATMYEWRGEYKKSQALIEERLDMTTDREEEGLVLESHELLACSTFHQGEFDQALEHADDGLRLYNPQSQYPLCAAYGDDPGVSCHDWAALSLWFLGYPDQALDRAEEAVRLARDHSYSLACAQTRIAWVHQCRREITQTQHWAEAAIEVAGRQGFRYHRAVGLILRGWALTMQGRVEEGLSQLRQGVADCRDTGAEMDRPYAAALLAEACAHSGAAAEGLELVDEALEVVRSSRSYFYEADLHRLQGTFHLQFSGQHRVDEAEACFRKALEIARRQEALSLELRAAMDLSRLWQQEHRSDEARSLVDEVYRRFTEGHDTPDLIAARKRLHTLAGS